MTKPFDSPHVLWRTMPIVIGLIGLSAVGCAQTDSEAPATDPQTEVQTEVQSEAQTEAGTLEFRANGEDFVRQGFVSKDGWQIDFDNLYVHFSSIKAQTGVPTGASSEAASEAGGEEGTKAQGGETVAEVPEATTVDLAAGDEQAEPVLIEAVEAPAGQYNGLSWTMSPAESGPASGSTLMLVGTAAKDGQTVPFTLRLDPEYTYTCGEFVGDARKGILEAGERAEVEATFHFDHVFGDGEAPADDPINTGALGFEPLAQLATDNTLDTDMAALEQSLSPQDYSTLEEALAGLGHVGEGHCSETAAGHAHEQEASS